MFFPEAGKIMSQVQEKLRAGGIVPCQATLGGLANRPEIVAEPVNAALNGGDPQRELKIADIGAIAEARVASLARAQVAAAKLSGSMGDHKVITRPHSPPMLEQAAARLPFFAKGRAGNMSGEAHCVALDAEFATLSPADTQPDKVTGRYAAAVAEATPHHFGEIV